MWLVAPAKLNLYLHITGRRGDGFHLLDSLAVFTRFGDEITISPSDRLELDLSGDFASIIEKHDNLVLQAVRLIQSTCDVKKAVHITLKKNIPVGAGLGGGSSDAAAVMIALNQLWDLRLTNDKLAEIGLSLGSDIPVCLYQRPAYVSGIGECLQPVSMPTDLSVLLINPLISLSTPMVYKAFQEPFGRPATKPEVIANKEKLLEMLTHTHNDLTKPAVSCCHVITDILAALQKTKRNLLSRMSGSGATCFGLYQNDEDSAAAARFLERQFPDYWIRTTHIGQNGKAQ